jgi:hypothetical protein
MPALTHLSLKQYDVTLMRPVLLITNPKCEINLKIEIKAAKD